MTLDDLQALLSETGLPFAYHHWEAPPSPPYGVFLDPGSDNFMADDRVFLPVSQVQIELYAKVRDQAAEAAVEQVLDEAGIPYEKGGAWIPSERLYQTVYEIEV